MAALLPHHYTTIPLPAPRQSIFLLRATVGVGVSDPQTIFQLSPPSLFSSSIQLPSNLLHMTSNATASPLRSSLHPLSTQCGLQVTSLCLGTASFRLSPPPASHAGPPAATPADTVAMLDAFVEAGGNFLDTAPAYGGGDSERAIGQWLQSKGPDFRSSLVIASKYGRGTGEADTGASRAAIHAAVAGSLQRLQTSYIDLYQQHVWMDSPPIEETLDVLDELVKQGKIRYVGCSNFASHHLQRARAYAKAKGLSSFISLQGQYSLLCRVLEWDMLPLCEDEGLVLLAFSPLAAGWLSGRYTRGGQTEGDKSTSRVAWTQSQSNTVIRSPLHHRMRPCQRSQPPLCSTSDGLPSPLLSSSCVPSSAQFAFGDDEHTWRVVEEVQSIAAELSQSPSAVSIRWILQRPLSTAVIIGPRTPNQLTDNLRAVEFELSAEQMKRLTDVSRRDLPYPHDLIHLMNARQPW